MPERVSTQLILSGKERKVGRQTAGFLSKTSVVIGRSFFPLLTIAVIVGAMLWGPWVSLAVVVLAIAAALRLI